MKILVKKDCTGHSFEKDCICEHLKFFDAGDYIIFPDDCIEVVGESKGETYKCKHAMSVVRLSEIKETARLLLNEDIEVSRECGEPTVEERPFDVTDLSRGNTCFITVGGGEILAEIKPYEGDTLRWYADAVSRAGWEMLELINELESCTKFTPVKAEPSQLCKPAEQPEKSCESCGDFDAVEHSGGNLCVSALRWPDCWQQKEQEKVESETVPEQHGRLIRELRKRVEDLEKYEKLLPLLEAIVDVLNCTPFVICRDFLRIAKFELNKLEKGPRE